MMSRSRLPVALTLVLSAAVAVAAFQSSPANRPWPPQVQPMPPESPPLPPAQALQSFYMPPGYHLELVASEPLIQDPIAIDWDAEGRIWAVEMPGFMPNITAAGEQDPVGRIVVLQDTDRDGRMDKRTVFADGLVLARAVKVLDRGVLVAEPPNVWFMHDTDGDLRMDTRELVTDQYGRREADPQNNANGFYWALDNRMHTAGQSDIYLREKGGRFEVHPTARRGEWGVTQDDAGRIYRNTNESALHVDLVPTPYFARNPGLLRTRGSYERLADQNGELNTVWPVRPNPGTNRAYQAGIDRPDGTLARFTSVCAPEVFRGDRLPKELYGNVFVAEPAANLVSRIVLDDDGGAIRARKAYERGEFLASTDERFRPVFLSSAPDGTLYVVDMYRGIIEHRISITVYLRDQILERKLEQPTGYGRIYRVVHETTRRDTDTALADASSARLVEMLSHPNGWWRDTAHRLLVERDARDAAPALTRLATTAPDLRTRLHALWILDGIDAIQPSTVTTSLEDASADVRVAALRIAERWLGTEGHPVLSAVLKLGDDPNAGVRRQFAASLGALPAAARQQAAVALFDKSGEDPIVIDAGLSSLDGMEEAVLDLLTPADAPRTAGREAATTMLAATIVRAAGAAPVARILAKTADPGIPEWVKSAVLRGAEVALLGATMPGTVERRPAPLVANAPCPTCPGGRAGPGGAYAFTKPDPASGRGAAASRGPRLRLTREPAALAQLSRSTDPLASRASAILSRIEWPGKPGSAEPVAPLSAAEQQRFDAGREVYRNICQGCHQPDGRGQDRLAPPLVGSVLALAAPEIPIRILLHGKEGPIGLMPPIGFALNDDQIAAVLTYIRREWNQTGTPVDPRTVGAVRAQTAARTRPWTNAELNAIVEKGR